MDVWDRLRHARERSGLTGTQVSKITGIGESSLSEFEKGKREPRLSQLQALARVYNRSLAFFFSDEPVSGEVVLWRQRPVKNAEEIESRFLRHCEQYHNLEVWCNVVTSPSLPEMPRKADSFSYGDAEELAKAARGTLGLGDRPGHELLRTLEEHFGVKVFHGEFEPTGTAASTKSDVFGPAILLNRGNVRWRRNFDLAHELFHLLTWSMFRSQEEGSAFEAGEREEKLATCFARHLLMPVEAIRMSVQRHTHDGKLPVEAYLDMAREFDVSLEALIWHLHFLYGRDQAETEREQQRASELCLFEQRNDTLPPKWPERYHALTVEALQSGEMSVGRFAEYLNISRNKAMEYVEQEAKGREEAQAAPA